MRVPAALDQAAAGHPAREFGHAGAIERGEAADRGLVQLTVHGQRAQDDELRPGDVHRDELGPQLGVRLVGAPDQMTRRFREAADNRADLIITG
jgi:hypothetical protein